jgi:hypothetical protein
MHTDNNFPAALQAIAFLSSAMVGGVLLLATVYGLIQKKDWAKRTLTVLLAGLGIYVALVLGFSMFSKEATLAHGEEKYFCEIDCHLAYSISDVKWSVAGANRTVTVTVQTRFDENTISTHRPKDAPLTPSPRKVALIDQSGHSYLPSEIEGTPLLKELIPGEAYTTEFHFSVPQPASGLRLLITAPEGPVRMLIGNEMSLGHKKTYLGI